MLGWDIQGERSWHVRWQRGTSANNFLQTMQKQMLRWPKLYLPLDCFQRAAGLTLTPLELTLKLPLQ